MISWFWTGCSWILDFTYQDASLFRKFTHNLFHHILRKRNHFVSLGAIKYFSPISFWWGSVLLRNRFPRKNCSAGNVPRNSAGFPPFRVHADIRGNSSADKFRLFRWHRTDGRNSHMRMLEHALCACCIYARVQTSSRTSNVFFVPFAVCMCMCTLKWPCFLRVHGLFRGFPWNSTGNGIEPLSNG